MPSDKDREDEARKFASLIYENYGHGKNDAHDRIIERDARIRAEAATEKEREMMHQINAATQSVIRLSSGEYVNAVAWVDAMENEAKTEALREAAERAVRFHLETGIYGPNELRAAILADGPNKEE